MIQFPIDIEWLFTHDIFQNITFLILLIGVPITYYIHKIKINQTLRYKVAWQQFNVYLESIRPIKEKFKSDYIKSIDTAIYESRLTMSPVQRKLIIDRHSDLLDICFDSVDQHMRIKLLSNHIPRPVAVNCSSNDCVNCNKIDCFDFINYIRGAIFQVSQLIWSIYRDRYDEEFFKISIYEREKRITSGEIISRDELLNEFKKLCIRWYNIAHPKKKRIWDFVFSKNKI